MELPSGIRRITTQLPTRPGHVHSYLLPGDDGWTLVDTGIGLPDAQAVWKAALDGAEVARIFVTHFHPDHVGAAADVAELTGAPVYQGELDYAQCELVWANEDWPTRIADWFLTHGVPSEITEELIESGSIYRPFIRYQPNPQLVDDGDRLDGWELVAAPGHADGQLCLLADDVLDLSRPSARTDHADRGPLAGEPARPARRLHRVVGADDRARADRSRCRDTAIRSRIRSVARAS